jgi:type IV secretion system protein VirB10
MAEETPPELQNRLDDFQSKTTKKPRSRLGVGALAAVLALGGAVLAYLLATGLQDRSDPLSTSDVESFQDQRRGNAARLEFPAEEERRVEEALVAVERALEPQGPTPAPSAPDETVLNEIAALREALVASQSARNSEIQAAVSDLRDAFEAQTDALESSIAERDTELDALRRESEARMSGLQVLLDAEREQREALESEMQRSGQIADQQLLVERQRLEEEQRQRDDARVADDLLNAQIIAPAIVYGGGSKGGSGSSTATAGSDLAADQPRQGIGENEDYLLRAAKPLQVAEAARMQFPHRTLAQGSIVQAALQTAINSDLPGNVVAVVSEPVMAFSGDNILIPRGSRLFGQYRSGVERNQKRILILWTRILTPDGTSMTIAATGGDQLGRSGLTGLVETKFMARFGGAALISIIGAAPAIAASRSDNETTSIVLENVGGNLEDAIGSVIADQISIAPTIYVDQGRNVTVIVDRDIVIY